MLAIDDRDVLCTIKESLRAQLVAKLVPSARHDPEDFEATVQDVARNVAQAVLLCGDEMPDRLIAEMAKHVRER